MGETAPVEGCPPTGWLLRCSIDVDDSCGAQRRCICAQRGMMSAAVSSAGPDAVASSHDVAAPSPLRCALIVLRRLCAAHHTSEAGCSLHSTHPCPCTSARKLSDYRKRHFADDVHHKQSALLRVHKRSLSAASVTTAHRVCGKWPWPQKRPANQPSGAEVPGCERRITVSGLVSRRSAFLRPGSGTPQ